MAADKGIVAPNLGLYLGRAPMLVPARGLQNGINFRITEGRLSTLNMGYLPFSNLDFGGPINLIDTFSIRDVAQKQIIGTVTDLFDYDIANDTATYITPVYNVGTVDVSADADAIVSVDTGTPAWATNGILPGHQISFGASDENDPAATWYTVNVVNETTLELDGPVTGAPLTGQAYTIRRTFQGALTDPWSTAIFVFPDDGINNDQWFATNGIDQVVYWDGSADHAIVASGLGFVCKALIPYKNQMLYCGIVEYNGEPYPSSIINSDIGKPLAAGDAGTGISEQFRVHDGVDGIIHATLLGDNVALYSNRHVVLAQFVGGDLVFIFRIAVDGVGAIGSRLIANFGDYHEFIGHDAQYLFDGISAQEVNKHIWRTVLNARDPSRHELGFHHFDEQAGELLWFVALTSDTGVGNTDMPPEICYTEHYLEEVGNQVPTPYSKREAPFACAGDGVTQGVLTWDEMTLTWEDYTFRWSDSTLFSAVPITLVGGADGTLQHLNGAQTHDSVERPNFAHFGRRILGDGRMRGLLARVYPFMTQLVNSVLVTTYYADHASGPVTTTQQDSYDLSLPQEINFVTPYRRGRFFEVQFGSLNGAPWECDGYSVDVRAGGNR